MSVQTDLENLRILFMYIMTEKVIIYMLHFASMYVYASCRNHLMIHLCTFSMHMFTNKSVNTFLTIIFF